MTIFEYISDVLHTKRKSVTSVEDEQEFSPFLLNRWLSMYSPSIAQHCNIINRYMSVFTSKQDMYNFFQAIIPKQPFKKIIYFKKKKQEEVEKQEEISLIAKNKELSKREILFYFEALKSIKH